MKIANRQILDKYVTKNANALNVIEHWIDIMEQAECESHNDLKKLFPSADYVGNGRYVFNIGGNKYRLVAAITFIAGLAVVRFIGTHAEYDKINCKII